MKEELNENKVNPIDTSARREEEQTNEHQDMLVNHSDKADELIYKAEIKTDGDWINSKTMSCTVAPLVVMGMDKLGIHKMGSSSTSLSSDAQLPRCFCSTRPM